MTRVDEHGIPCIVQIINIIPEHYAILVCTYFDDEVLLFNRDIINPFSTPYGWDMEKIEQFLINKWLEFKGIKNGNILFENKSEGSASAIYNRTRKERTG